MCFEREELRCLSIFFNRQFRQCKYYSDYPLHFSGSLPPATEDYDEANNVKTITEYKYNDDGKMVKVGHLVNLSC